MVLYVLTALILVQVILVVCFCRSENRYGFKIGCFAYAVWREQVNVSLFIFMLCLCFGLELLGDFGFDSLDDLDVRIGQGFGIRIMKFPCITTNYVLNLSDEPSTVLTNEKSVLLVTFQGTKTVMMKYFSTCTARSQPVTRDGQRSRQQTKISDHTCGPAMQQATQNISKTGDLFHVLPWILVYLSNRSAT